ncbi:MAG: hypothetical protein AB1445_08755 [Bacillota bacterium]
MALVHMGVELYCDVLIPIWRGTCFAIHLFANGQVVAGSAGVDGYDYDGLLVPGRRVAATGRTAHYRVNRAARAHGLGSLEARPARPVSVPALGTLALHVLIRPALPPEYMLRAFSMRLLAGARFSCHYRLSRPELAARILGPGQLELALTRLLDPSCP